MTSGATTGVVDRGHLIGIAILGSSAALAAALVAALAAALVMGACGSDPAPPDAPSGTPTLSAIRSEIFNGTCALGSCHAPPTLAARLDLRSDDLCRFLVRKSCLFSNKVLVLPGKPEASFLLDKLRGTGLAGTPDPACATSNERMPLGQPPLSGGKIAQIEEWIRTGADCSGQPPVDAAIDAPAESLADVTSVSAAATTIQVGQPTQVTVTLTHGAPSSGQLVIVDIDDSAILEVPNAVTVGPGISSTMFDVRGKMAGLATLTISSGTNSQSITITVTGLTLCDDKNSMIQLAGTLPGARHLVIGS